MSPSRWLEAPPSDAAETRMVQALEIISEPPLWTADERDASWRALRAAAASPRPARSRVRTSLAFAVALAVVCTASVSLWRARGPAPASPGVGVAPSSGGQAASPVVVEPGIEAWLSAGASLRDDAEPVAKREERRVYLDQGTAELRVAPRPGSLPFVVVTPHARVVVVGTRFTVHTSDATEVVVSEGTVRLEAEGRTPVLLTAGQTQRSDALEPIVSEPVDPWSGVRRELEPGSSRSAPDCRQNETRDWRRRCFERRARGNGLAAEQALFELALLAREEGATDVALRWWKLYQRRFGKGVFGPEVGAAVVDTLISLERYEDALDETRRWSGRFGADEVQAAGMALARGMLIERVRDDPSEAARAFAEALALAPHPELAAEALYLRGEAHLRDNALESARRDFQRYLNEYPRGPRRARIQAFLAER